ncbi:C40 family peptidase [Kocuria sp.]|uniref:C40 family peptidase n=1 Tax=Kocuria sp. TaxID=1871328 RepID=UPI0026DF26AD|nr:C40 family peptidase [Kocuria sp.]MDO5618934.1 C40 family peptidase [Kocuria sp.]
MQNVKTVARRAGLGIAVAGIATAATIAPASAYAEVPGATTNGTVPSNTTSFDYSAAEASGWNYSWSTDANGNTTYTYGNGATSAAPAASTSYQAPAAEAPAAQASGVSTQSVANTGGIAGTAQSFVGAPYVWGGTTPGGWDCSGFTQYVYAQHGIQLPRIASAQGQAGTPTSNPQPGDLVIQNGGSHVGIYLGNGQMISALNPGQGTQVHPVSAMSVDYYATFA